MDFSSKTRFLLRTLFIFIMVMFVPLFAATTFGIVTFRNHLLETSSVSLELTRDDVVHDTMGKYEIINNELESFSLFVASDYLKGISASSLDNDVKVFIENKYIDNVYIFDKDKYLKYSSKDIDEGIIDNIQYMAFNTAFSNSDFFVDEGSQQAYQYIYYKIIKDGAFLGYTAFRVNDSLFEDVLDGNSDLDIIILNNDFSAIVSTDAMNKYKTLINVITKNMLDGYTSTESMDGNYHSYTSIELDGDNIYVDVTRSTESILAPIKNIAIFIIILYICCLMFTIIIYWKYTHRQLRSSEKLLLSSNDKLSRKYQDMAVLLDDTVDELDRVLQMQNESHNSIMDILKSNEESNSLSEEKLKDLINRIEENLDTDNE